MSDGSRDMARTKSWRKRKRKKKNERVQNHIASPTGIANNNNNNNNNTDIITIVKFTQLCSKFPPTAFLNFACDG